MKLIRRIRKFLLLFLPLMIALSVGWYLRTESDFFIVRDLQVDVEFEENQEALLVSLKPELAKLTSGLKGENIWKVGLSGVRAALLKHPWIREVELGRKFPSQIVTLIKLEPVALLYHDKKNRIFPILENSKKMPQIAATLAPVAPILRNNKILKDEEKLKMVLNLISEVPRIGPLKKENIESVDFSSVTGLSLKLIKEDLVVHLGSTNIQTKALQVLRVTDYLQSQKQNARVIDASFTKKVLVRLRKRS